VPLNDDVRSRFTNPSYPDEPDVCVCYVGNRDNAETDAELLERLIPLAEYWGFRWWEGD
jgi:hypothetical protein